MTAEATAAAVRAGRAPVSPYLHRVRAAELDAAEQTGVLVSPAPPGHLVFRVWGQRCDRGRIADLRVRLSPRFAHVEGDLLPAGTELDADGAAWIASLAPKYVAARFAGFREANYFAFRVARERLREVEVVLACLARGEGTQRRDYRAQLARVVSIRTAQSGTHAQGGRRV